VFAWKIGLISALTVLAAVGLMGAGTFLGRTTYEPRIEIREVPTIVPGPTVTSRVTVIVTKPVTVPSAVFVTVTPQPARMTEYEARAYCQNLATEAWPYGAPTGDALLDGLARAYTNTQRDRYFQQCMKDKGY